MENRTEEYVKATEKFINCFGVEKLKVAKGWANMHRYLVNEMFVIVLRFIGILAKNYDDGHYDGRDRYACSMSKKIIDYLKQDGSWTDYFIDDMKD